MRNNKNDDPTNSLTRTRRTSTAQQKQREKTKQIAVDKSAKNIVETMQRK